MLRIRRKGNGEVVFTISGQIDKEHIAELEALIAAERKDRRIILDLKDMTLTGEDGIAFLARSIWREEKSRPPTGCPDSRRGQRKAPAPQPKSKTESLSRRAALDAMPWTCSVQAFGVIAARVS